MGEVAFIVLRKREGLLQCVYEEGKTQFDLKDLKEAATIEVEGTVKPEERAPHGFEIRLDQESRYLSETGCTDAACNLKMEIEHLLWRRSLNNACVSPFEISGSVQNSSIQEGVVRGFRDFLIQSGVYRDPYTEDRSKKCRGRGKPVPAGIFPQTGSACSRALSFTSR